ncbi:MAG: hypothetical protein AB1422_01000 [bacterium]
MKKLTLLTMLVLGLLATATYTTTVYAEDTQAYYTQNNTPVPSSIAWGTGVNTPYQSFGGGPCVATMTHTFYYDRECIVVDIDDDHLEWTSRAGEADYMIMWTNIYAWAAATGTYYLQITATGTDHIKRSDGATITTSYALVPPSGPHPTPGDFILAPAFNGNLPNTPIEGVNGSPVRYDRDLWARVQPTNNNPLGKYEDVFYLTFAITLTP